MIPLNDGERVIHVARKHWFLAAAHTLNVTVVFLLPIIVYFLVINRTFTTDLGSVSLSFSEPGVVILTISVWGLILWLRFWSFWTDYHLDGWVITNKRIIDIEQRGFFRRSVSNLRLERIQDVTTKVSGIIATFLKFGEVHVQTAGADKEFTLHNTPNPEFVRDIILKAHGSVMESGMYSKDSDGTGTPMP